MDGTSKATYKRTPSERVPSKPVFEQIKRLGLPLTEIGKIIGVSVSGMHNWQSSGTMPLYASLAVECLVRRQSRDATCWALLKLNHGVAEVLALGEAPQ